MDTSVNLGPREAGMMLQRSVDLTGDDVDGWIGKDTLAIINARSDLLSVAKKFVLLRDTYYRSLADFATFGKGWIARLDDCAMLAYNWMGQTAPLPTPAPVAVPPVAPPVEDEADKLMDEYNEGE